MAPKRRNLLQRNEDKGARLHARVRELRRTLLYPPVIIEQIEVEGTRRVGDAAPAPKRGFYLVEFGQKCGRGEIGLDCSDGIDERRIIRIGPRCTSVETGTLHNRYASAGEFLKRRIKRCRRRAGWGRKVRSKRYKDHGLLFPIAADRPTPDPLESGHLQISIFTEDIKMLFYPQERIALFVDGANLYGAAKGLQFDIDYKRLLELFARKGLLVRAFYYTALAEDQEFSPLRPLIDWLDYNGFTVVTKPLKEYTDAQGRRRVKGNMDIELAIDVMEMSERVDHVVIFSGDGDFRKLVEAVQRRGRRVSVCSTIRTQPPMVADELRRQADNFIELDELKSLIMREGGRPMTSAGQGNLETA
jgi:uncharacterized LabA/DUF88 family protein